MPETCSDVHYNQDLNHNFWERASKAKKDSSAFFRYLLTTVPAVMGKSDSDGNEDHRESGSDLADETAYASRCQQLLTCY